MLRKSGELPKARLEAAGYMAPAHRQYLAYIENKIAADGLSDEFHYRGVLDRQQKIAFLRNLDVLSVPATYDEPKGMFLLEAMACGVPLVQPRRGAFTEIIEKTGSGLLVEPDDPQSLADGILRLINEPALAEKFGQNGFQKVREYYSVARMADSALGVYEDLVSRGFSRTNADREDRRI